MIALTAGKIGGTGTSIPLFFERFCNLTQGKGILQNQQIIKKSAKEK